MEFIGKVKIVLEDTKTGKTRTHCDWESNLIPRSTYLDITSSGGLGLLGPLTVFSNSSSPIGIAFSGQEPAFDVDDVAGFIAQGSRIDNAMYFPDADPPFVEFSALFNSVGTDRDFNQVFLGGSFGNNVDSHLFLSVTCTQGPTEILRIFYRIQFLFPTTSSRFFLAGQRNSLVNSLILGALTLPPGTPGLLTVSWNFAFTSYCVPPLDITDWQRLPIDNIVSQFASTSSGIGRTFFGLIDDLNFKGLAEIQLNEDFEQQRGGSIGGVGTLINGLGYGAARGGGGTNVETVCAVDRYEGNSGREPFQTIFGHGPGAPGPFSDTAFLPTGTGSLVIAGSWENRIPEMWRIQVTGSGNPQTGGTSTYRVFVRKTPGGWQGNNWNLDREGAHWWTDPRGVSSRKVANPNLKLADDLTFYRPPVALSEREVIVFNETGLSVLDIYDGTLTVYDADSDPAMPSVNIGQVAVDPGSRILYVADRGVGLLVVDLVNNTVSEPILGLQACYGVARANDGTVYFHAPGGLYRGTGDLVAVPPSLTGFSVDGVNGVADTRVLHVHVNPTNSDEVAIALRNPDTEANSLYWYNGDTAATTLGVSGNVSFFTGPGVVTTTEDGAFWLWSSTSSIFRLNFEQIGNGTNLGGNAKASLVRDELDVILVDRGRVLTTSGVEDVATNTVTISVTEPLAAATSCCVLPGGTVWGDTGTSYFYYRGGFGDDAWFSYGWDGAQWVLDEPGDRPIDDTVQDLPFGLTVDFVAGPTGTSFVAGEFYTFGVNFGILYDNITELDTQYAFYYGPVAFAADPVKTIPSEPPYTLTLDAALSDKFLRIDSNNPNQTHVFLVNGQPVTEIFTSGETPNAQEVTINPTATTNNITFAAANAGQSFEAVRYAALLEAFDPVINQATL